MKDKLNPWNIEVDRCSNSVSMRLNIVNQNTGEIKQINLSVDDIANIESLSVDRINKIAEKYSDDETDFSLMVDKLIGYKEPESYND